MAEFKLRDCARLFRGLCRQISTLLDHRKVTIRVLRWVRERSRVRESLLEHLDWIVTTHCDAGTPRSPSRVNSSKPVDALLCARLPLARASIAPPPSAIESLCSMLRELCNVTLQVLSRIPRPRCWEREILVVARISAYNSLRLDLSLQLVESLEAWKVSGGSKSRTFVLKRTSDPSFRGGNYLRHIRKDMMVRNLTPLSALSVQILLGRQRCSHAPQWHLYFVCFMTSMVQTLYRDDLRDLVVSATGSSPEDLVLVTFPRPRSIDHVLSKVSMCATSYL